MSIEIWICITLLAAGTYGNPGKGDNIFDTSDEITDNTKWPNLDKDGLDGEKAWLDLLNKIRVLTDLKLKRQEMNASELCSTQCGSSTCCGQTHDKKIFTNDNVTTTYCCPGPNQVCCGATDLRFGAYCCGSGSVCGDHWDVRHKCKKPKVTVGETMGNLFTALWMYIVLFILLPCVFYVGKAYLVDACKRRSASNPARTENMESAEGLA